MTDSTRVTEAFAIFGDVLTIALEMVTGHREKCIANGFSPTAAEAMAVTAHSTVLGVILSQTATPKSRK